MRYILNLLLIFIVNSSSAQLQIGFDTTILCGADKMIYQARGIKIDKNNNKYLIGSYKYSKTIDNDTVYTHSSVNHELSVGIYLIKFNASNEYLWMKKIGESDTVNAYYHDIDHLGNVYIAITYRSKLYIENDTINSIGLSDFILAKYDSQGNKIFDKRVQSECFEFIRCLSISEDAIYISGEFGTDVDNTVNNCPTFFDSIYVNNTNKVYIAKLDLQGNYIWIKTHNVGNIAKMTYKDGGLYAIGFCINPFGTIGNMNFSFSTSYNQYAYIAKIDTSGLAKWVNKFGANNPNLQPIMLWGLDIHKNRVFIGGHSFSNYFKNLVFEGGPTLISYNSGWDYFIASYDTSGQFKWNLLSNSIGAEAITQLVCDSDANVYAAGKFNYTLYFPGDTLYGYGGDDLFVCSYDSVGSFRWAVQGGGGGVDVANGIALDSDGVPYIVGGTNSSMGMYMGNDILYPPTSQSTLFYARIGEIASWPSSTTTHIAKAEPTIYPNPGRNYFRVKLPVQHHPQQLHIFDTHGRELYNAEITSHSAGHTVHTTAWPSGMYILRIGAWVGKWIQE